jgi:hypothetical protein
VTPPRQEKAFYYILQLGFLLTLLLAFEGICADYGFQIRNAELLPSDSSYVLNADIDYRFSAPAIEALKHGVPLTLVIRFKIMRHRHYWLNETVVTESRKLHIRYHPLAKSYQIVYEDHGIADHFVSLAALLEHLGSIRNWSIPAANHIDPGQEYYASLAVDLDIESLPLPLRPMAYMSPSWYLGSSWYRWRIVD